jgi:hypothetical protein
MMLEIGGLEGILLPVSSLAIWPDPWRPWSTQSNARRASGNFLDRKYAKNLEPGRSIGHAKDEV